MIGCPPLPGATLGVLGGGQLGRMFTLAAKVMGYQVVVLDPDPASPAGQLADTHLKADYRDAVALLRMGSLCDAVTTEFENVPAESMDMLAKHCRVAPSAAGPGRGPGPPGGKDPRPRLRLRDRALRQYRNRRRPGCGLGAGWAPPPCSRPAAWAMTARARRG
jgi:hypothetical protein